MDQMERVETKSKQKVVREENSDLDRPQRREDNLNESDDIALGLAQKNKPV